MSDELGTLLMFLVSMLVIFIFASFSGLNLGFKLWGVQPLRKEYKLVLKKYSRFYNGLSPKDRLHFEKRIQYFIKVKKFIPRSIPSVTGEMKVLIAATAVQMIYGFPNIYLSHFDKILIYPDNYYSTINKMYHQGEVNPLNRIIVLSWKSFYNGIVNEDSGINLGLHEMAHALRLENVIRNSDYDFLDKGILDKWNVLALKEINYLRKGKSTFFRDYGGSSEDEFFAVAIENFFERPQIFKDYNEELFETLRTLLKQP